MRTAEQTGAAPHADGPTVAIIVGSTRPGRKADTVARWVHDLAARDCRTGSATRWNGDDNLEKLDW